jgi:hypothetical protein
MLQYKKRCTKPESPSLKDAKHTMDRIPIMMAAANIVSRKEQITETISKDATMVIFPDTKTNSIKLQVFGPIFTRFVDAVVNNSDECCGQKIKPYLKQLSRYKIQDYHYQNQCDRPDGISAREWTEREKCWNRLMPTGIPSKDGIVIEIFDAADQLDDEIMIDIFTNKNHVYDTIIRHMPDKNTMTRKKAEEVILNKYVDMRKAEFCDETEELSYCNFSKIERDFKKELENPESETSKSVSSLTDRLLPYTLDFTCDKTRKWMTEFGTCPVTDFMTKPLSAFKTNGKNQKGL